MNPAGKLIFKDASTGQVTVFHYHTFYEMVIACIVGERMITLTGTMII